MATKTKKNSSLVGNINRRKKSGTSRAKATSTVSNEAYTELRKGWPKSHRARTSEGRRKPRHRSA
jgi:hypothetical protein